MARPRGDASSQAVVALVLAIGSWVLCGCLASLPAVFLAKSELDAIRRGESSPGGEGIATAALWIGAINSILWLFFVLIYGVLIAVGLVAAVTLSP